MRYMCCVLLQCYVDLFDFFSCIDTIIDFFKGQYWYYYSDTGDSNWRSMVKICNIMKLVHDWHIIQPSMLVEWATIPTQPVWSLRGDEGGGELQLYKWRADTQDIPLSIIPLYNTFVQYLCIKPVCNTVVYPCTPLVFSCPQTAL